MADRERSRMEAPAVLTRLSSTSPPAYEQSVPVPVTTTEGYSEVTADVTTNDHSLSQERIAGCCKSLPVHKQSLASGTLSVLCTALVLYSCVSTRWLVRPMKRLWMGVGEEIAERTSSAMTLGLYQICEETELNQCFAYLTTSDVQYTKYLWDVDYHRSNGQLYASQALCLLSLLAGFVALATVIGRCAAARAVVQFRFLLIHVLACLTSCLSSILCAMIFFLWSDLSLRKSFSSEAGGDFANGRFTIGAAFLSMSSSAVVSSVMSFISLYAICTATGRKATDVDIPLTTDYEQATVIPTSNSNSSLAAPADLPPPYLQVQPQCTCQSSNEACTATNWSVGDGEDYSPPDETQAVSNVALPERHRSPTPEPPHSVTVLSLSPDSRNSSSFSSVISQDIPRNFSSSSVVSTTSTASAASVFDYPERPLVPTSRVMSCSRCYPEPLLSPQELVVRFTELSMALSLPRTLSVLCKDMDSEMPPPYVLAQDVV